MLLKNTLRGLIRQRQLRDMLRPNCPTPTANDFRSGLGVSFGIHSDERARRWQVGETKLREIDLDMTSSVSEHPITLCVSGVIFRVRSTQLLDGLAILSERRSSRFSISSFALLTLSLSQRMLSC